jgi:sulfonate transport system permease protein
MSVAVETRRRHASPPRPIEKERFLPLAAHPSRMRRAFDRLRWPLGIYTTPVVLFLLWEVVSRLGWLPENIAPAPTTILHAGYELWQRGELVPSLTTSLGRAGAGLAIGLAVGVTAGVLGGLLRTGVVPQDRQ